MAAWAIGGAATADNAAQCANDTVLGAETCTDARNAGTGIAVVLIFLLWFVGFIILSLIWFMSRPKGASVPGLRGEREARAHDVQPLRARLRRGRRAALWTSRQAEPARRVTRWRP